ncbi:MAG: hypothetical protein RSH78_04610 [Bacilli bacterium]
MNNRLLKQLFITFNNVLSITESIFILILHLLVSLVQIFLTSSSIRKSGTEEDKNKF